MRRKLTQGRCAVGAPGTRTRLIGCAGFLIVALAAAPNGALAFVPTACENTDTRTTAGEVHLAQAQSIPVIPDPPPLPPQENPDEIPLPDSQPDGPSYPGIIRKPRPQEPTFEPEPGARSPPLDHLWEQQFPGHDGIGATPQMVLPDDGSRAPIRDHDPRDLIGLPGVRPFAIILPRAALVPIDTRIPVAAPDLEFLPYSAIGKIVIRSANGAQESGTGFLIAPGVVLTAAHVLHSHRIGPAVEVTFIPGCRLGKGDAANLAQTVGRRLYRVADRWVAGDRGIAADYGVVVLPPAPWHAVCRWIVMRDIDESFYKRHFEQRTNRFMLPGFPGDMPAHTAWVGSGSLYKRSGAELRHLIDTNVGQSGAPVIAVVVDETTRKRIPLVVGIHSREGAAVFSYNAARIMDPALIADVTRLVTSLGGKLSTELP